MTRQFPALTEDLVIRCKRRGMSDSKIAETVGHDCKARHVEAYRRYIGITAGAPHCEAFAAGKEYLFTERLAGRRFDAADVQTRHHGGRVVYSMAQPGGLGEWSL